MNVSNSLNSLTINYSSTYIGTNTSEITFFDSDLDLISLFNPGREDGPRRFFITDATVASLDSMKSFLSKFDDNICNKDVLLIMGSGERYKTIQSVLTIIQSAIENNFSRNDIFVGIGGGVICDITAFSASIFKRGTSVQFVPTTLLAMVDASLGGKTGCDFENYKNMIGTFFPATNIYYFPQFVQSLPENQFYSGLAEAFKTAILYDKELYDIFKNESEKIKARDIHTINIIIQKCVKAKSRVVEEDFTEKNIRAFLNLGHTFGHALESILGLGVITHGEAVAWGIGRQACLSLKKEYCKESYTKEILQILELYGWETKAIPEIIQGGGFGERLLSLMKKDKKNLNEKIRLIISKNVNDTVIEEVSEADILSVIK